MTASNTPLFPDHVEAPEEVSSSSPKIILIVLGAIVGLLLVGTVAMSALGNNVDAKFDQVGNELDSY